ncbi:MAG: acetate kinase [Candidatus Brockarchaeota archaeon]|nr:acetate kinase [Candidatus Brockarchaeota archaeon]
MRKGKVLVVNCGSSSIKYSVFEAESVEEVSGGLLERIGGKSATLKHRVGPYSVELEIEARDHRQGLEQVLRILHGGEVKAVESLAEIIAVGHRVVHGGDAFFESTLIDDRVLDTIKDWAELAPLHNPPNIAGVEAAKSLLPGIPQVAVFDTAFHQTMPEKAYLYPIPYELYKRHRIRRYGFHGTSHGYVARKAAEMLGMPLKALKIVTCHLGNGCSVTAVRNGKSVDTSMGFTPLEGLVMGTRSGDIDPSIIFYMMDKEKLSAKEIENVLNRSSGLLGISGVSNDVRDIEREAGKGNRRAALALEIFAYRAKKYVGAYAAAMGGLDAIVFTGGIGENDPTIRSMICADLGFLGVKLDGELNAIASKDAREISSSDSAVKILVIPTNEELVIAIETLRLVKGDMGKQP